LNPKNVRDEGISEGGLRNFKQKIKNGKGLKKWVKNYKDIFEYYKAESIGQ